MNPERKTISSCNGFLSDGQQLRFLWHIEPKNIMVTISRRQFDALFLIDLVKAE
jgi:hypothetical protein